MDKILYCVIGYYQWINSESRDDRSENVIDYCNTHKDEINKTIKQYIPDIRKFISLLQTKQTRFRLYEKQFICSHLVILYHTLETFFFTEYAPEFSNFIEAIDETVLSKTKMYNSKTLKSNGNSLDLLLSIKFLRSIYTDSSYVTQTPFDKVVIFKDESGKTITQTRKNWKCKSNEEQTQRHTLYVDLIDTAIEIINIKNLQFNNMQLRNELGIYKKFAKVCNDQVLLIDEIGLLESDEIKVELDKLQNYEKSIRKMHYLSLYYSLTCSPEASLGSVGTGEGDETGKTVG